MDLHAAIVVVSVVLLGTGCCDFCDKPKCPADNTVCDTTELATFTAATPALKTALENRKKSFQSDPPQDEEAEMLRCCPAFNEIVIRDHCMPAVHAYCEASCTTEGQKAACLSDGSPFRTSILWRCEEAMLSEFRNGLKVDESKSYCGAFELANWKHQWKWSGNKLLPCGQNP